MKLAPFEPRSENLRRALEEPDERRRVVYLSIVDSACQLAELVTGRPKQDVAADAVAALVGAVRRDDTQAEYVARSHILALLDEAESKRARAWVLRHETREALERALTKLEAEEAEDGGGG
ncbi:MAG TPA: hypothetical protein VLC09_01220 [Polyangiaceae bacterium]|nr:hypothetical protein [Polyangiaceae bacterium]